MGSAAMRFNRLNTAVSDLWRVKTKELKVEGCRDRHGFVGPVIGNFCRVGRPALRHAEVRRLLQDKPRSTGRRPGESDVGAGGSDRQPRTEFIRTHIDRLTGGPGIAIQILRSRHPGLNDSRTNARR